MATIESSPPTRRAVAAGLLTLGLTAARRPPPFAPGFNADTHRTIPADNGADLDVWVLSRRGNSGEVIRLVWASVRGPDAGVRIIPVDRRGRPSELYGALDAPGIVAMVNGSFFQGQPGAPDETTMGLVRVDGRTLHPTSARTGGGFLTTNGRGISIVPKANAGFAEQARNAVESSPILIQGAQSGIRRDDRVRADRVAVGSLAGGGVAIVGAFAYGQDTVSLYQFEQLARGAATAKGVAFTDLLAMDGGPSAHIRLPRPRELFGATSSIYLTNVIALTVS